MADGATATTAYDIRGIAEALGVNKSSAKRRALRENWPYAEETARGGRRRIYDVSALPEDVALAMRRKHAISAASALASRDEGKAGQTIARRINLAESVDAEAQWRLRQAGAARAVGLTGSNRARMDARLHLLQALDQFATVHACGPCAALEQFSDAYRTGDLVVPEAVRAAIGPDVSPATLRRWQRTLRTQGAAALAGAYGKRAGTGRIESNEELRAFVLGMLVERPHLNAKHVHRGLSVRFSSRKSEIPPLRSLQRFISRWKTENAQLFTAVANPDAWKNQYMTAHGRADGDITRLNQRWEFDSTPADVLLVDGRHTIIGIIDIWSRRGMLHVSKTSSATGVCGAIRRAILDWGVLEEAKLDNGQDYVSHRVQRVFKALDVQVELSAPFSPWQKPHIERFFRTFSHDLLELLPGFAGHNVAEAQALRASKSFAERLLKKGATVEIKLTAAELQRFCDQWCENLYAHDPHEALGRKTPFERAASSRSAIRRIDDERVLDHLLAEAPDGHGGRTVTKKGIRVDGHYYIAPELFPHIGERVRVLYDEGDLGRIVVYRDEAFVCIATCPEIEGISRAELATAARQRQKEGIEALRKELKATARKQNLGEIAFEILEARQRDTAALAAMPAPNVVHVTPAIEAAQQAKSAEAAPSIDTSDVERVLNFDVIGRLLREASPAEDETAEGRFRGALALELKALKEPLSEIEQRRLTNYQDSPEYRSRRMIFDNWGPEYMGLGEDYRALLRDGLTDIERLEADQQQGI